jgi:phosphodiesterase/alkaline phosphatase D-like protein
MKNVVETGTAPIGILRSINSIFDDEGVQDMKIFAVLLLGTAMSAFAVQGAKPAHKSAAERITNGPKVEGVGPTWAVIAWTTNTGGSTIVHYGTDPNNLGQMAKAPYADNEKTKAQNHRVHIKNLKPNTKYYFVADSGQGEGTGTEAKSQVEEFTTKPKK